MPQPVPAVKVTMTRHYEGPHKDQFAAATAEARTIAGLTPRASARLLPRTGTSPGHGDAPAGTMPYPATRDGRIR